MSHAPDLSVENSSSLVILSIVGRKLKHKGLQQDKTALGFRKDYLLTCCVTEQTGRWRLPSTGITSPFSN